MKSPDKCKFFLYSHQGRKFLQILAACALTNTDALVCYIHILKSLDAHNWHWLFCGVLYLGTVACSSALSKISQAAISEGLLFFADSNHWDDSCNDKWKVRYGALLALTEVYQHFHNEPHGTVAREALENCRNDVNNHPIIEALLEKQITRVPQPQFIRKTHFLFKYCCLNLADHFSDGISDYKSLKKYSKLRNVYFDPTGYIRKKIVLEPALLVESLEKKFANLQTQELSLDPYHQNYKKVHFDPDKDLGENVAMYFEQSKLKKLPENLTPSVLGDSKMHMACTYNIGTANKRKVFQAHK